METITIIVHECYDLRDAVLRRQLSSNGFEPTNYLESMGTIIGQVSPDRIPSIESLNGVAWVEKNSV